MEKRNRMIKPSKLIAGNKVGIFLPSSPVKEPYRQNGINEIKEMGYIPVEVDNIYKNSGYTGKSPNEVARDINTFMTDSSIKALWAARGGYGSNMLLDKLEFFKNIEPKIVIGSSDVSYMLWKIMSISDMPVFYGPMAYSTVSEKKYDRENLVNMLSGNYNEIKIGGKVLQPGKVKRIVTGGCLSNLVSLCGTRHFPETKDRIVLLEDLNERPFRLERMMWQLSEINFFSGIKGIIFGEFPGCFTNEEEKSLFYSSITKYFDDFDYPVLFDMPFGHSSYAKTLPLGIAVSIDTSEFEGVSIREKGVI